MNPIKMSGNPRLFFRTNRYLLAIKAGSFSVLKAVLIKEIINFMSIFTDEVCRKNIGLLIACNHFFRGTTQVPSRRPNGKRAIFDRYMKFEFKHPEGSTNG
jgi:hypothetical protein